MIVSTNPRSPGKSPQNEVLLRALAQGDRGFVLTISDNGRGIAWEKVARKAALAGLPSSTRADLEEALYADSVSTRDEVSETNGRGVGLGAVRGVVTALGGFIEIESTLGQGTTFRLVLPWPAEGSQSSATGRAPVRAAGRASIRW